MRYSLSKDVYLVHGKVRSCLYDLNTGKLYSINGKLAQRIGQLNTSGIPDDDIDKELREIIMELVSEGLLVQEYMAPNQIISIVQADSKIQMAWLEITTKCNMRCRHCYNESESCCESEMSLEDYKKALDFVVKLGVSRIVIIGGEPFVKGGLLREMLDYSLGKINNIEIFTNGTLIGDEWFEYLRDNGIRIALSVYSYNPEEHDKVTGALGSWKKTNNTIRNLKAFGIPYRVCNILMKDVALGKRETTLYELSTEKDVVRMTGRANFNLLTDELIKKKLITKETFKVPITKEFCRRLVSGHNCYNSKLYVASNLDVYPCVMERRVKHCSLRNGNELELDQNILKFNKDKVESCCNCEYRYACFDCRPNSLSSNYFEKPWYCTYIPEQGLWIDKDRFVKELRKKWG